MFSEVKEDFRVVKNAVGSVVSSKAGKVCCALVVVGVASAVHAAGEPVTIPVIGVSVQDYISAGITLMGTVAGTAVGGYAAFLVVRRGLRWLGRALA